MLKLCINPLLTINRLNYNFNILFKIHLNIHNINKIIPQQNTPINNLM